MILLKVIFVVLYSFLNILLANHDAVKIFQHKKIEHGINALVYLALILPAGYLTNSWIFLIGLLALRRIVFDTALNLLRGLPFDYISSTTTSVIDRLSYKFQARFGYLTYYGIFAIMLIISIFL